MVFGLGKKIINKFFSKLFRIKYIFSLKKRDVIVGSSIIFYNQCQIEGNNRLGKDSLLDNFKLGRGSYVGEKCNFRNVEIGRFCSVGSEVKNIIGRHPVSTFVSTHPAFFSLAKQAGFTYVKEQKFKEKEYNKRGRCLTIGNDVWIGDNVIFLDGITVGDGAVIGAGALVTQDVEPYSISVGVPAKRIKYRFDKSDIEFLLEFKWWEKELDWIEENCDSFQDIQRLKQVIN